MEKIKNSFYWYLFYCAYWTAYELGEKDDPQINASGFLMLLTWISLSSFLNLINSLFKITLIPNIYIIISCMVFSIVINYYVLFKKKNGYKSKMKNFEFLKTKDFATKRYFILLSTFFLLFIFLVLSLLTNNIMFSIN